MLASTPKVAVRRPVASAAGVLFLAVLAAWATLAGAFKDPSVNGWATPLAAVALICVCACVMYLLKLQLRPRALRAAWVSALAVFVLAALTVPVTPGWAAAWRYDGRLPSATGCNDEQGTSTVTQWDVLQDGTDLKVATAQLRRSSACGTAWVRVQTQVAGASTVKSVSRPFSWWILGYDTQPESDPATDDWSWSRQVFAADCVEVDVVVTLQDGTSGTLHQGC